MHRSIDHAHAWHIIIGMGNKNNKSNSRLFSLSKKLIPNININHMRLLRNTTTTADHDPQNTITGTAPHVDPAPQLDEESAAPRFLPPPSDRFFMSPSASGSLACEHHPPLHASSPSIISDEMASVLQQDGLRSYCRFFVSPSSSALITLDPRVKPPSEPVTPSTSSNSNSTKIDALTSTYTSTSTSTSSSENGASSCTSSPLLIAGGGIALTLRMDSDDPYGDFRRSMLEMVQSHVMPDWHFLEDLLYSYLELNDSCVHHQIITAFADMVSAVLPCDERADGTVLADC